MKEQNSYLHFNSGKIEVSKDKLDKVETILEPGFYKLKSYETNQGVRTEIKKYEYDSIGFFTTENYRIMSEYLTSFLTKRKTLKDLKFKTTLGVLLEGKAGSGKTTLVFQKCKELIEKEGACVFLPIDHFSSIHCWGTIEDIRKTQDNLLCIFYDECENLMKDMEPIMKQRLDGVNSIENLITFACTNYVSRLPTTIVDRRSRFRYVIKFDGIEDRAQIEQVVLNILPDMDKKALSSFVDRFINSTLDEIKHGIQDIILGIDNPEPVKRSIGFHNNQSLKEKVSNTPQLKDYDFKPQTGSY